MPLFKEGTSDICVCIYVRACMYVKPDAWSEPDTFATLGRKGFSAGGLVKHEPFLSLQKKLCLKQGLFAPAVICLRRSAGANKYIRMFSFGGTKHRTNELNGTLCRELHRGRY